MKRWSALVLCGTLLACAEGASAGKRNDAIACELHRGMTERQVEQAAGGRVPDRIIMTTCGTQTPNPFSCRVYVYEGALRANGFDRKLSVIFEDFGGQWRIGQWL